MPTSSQINNRRAANAANLKAFGLADFGSFNGQVRTVREGAGATIFTIGYEKRDGDDLLSALRDVGVEYLADIRDKPMSRKPDFRASALRTRCEAEGLQYGPWKSLGSTEDQRGELKRTGDITRFQTIFRNYAEQELQEEVEELSDIAKTQSVALLCYERAHEECHRSVVADMVANRLDAEIVAIM